jgi:hypothetical protein
MILDRILRMIGLGLSNRNRRTSLISGALSICDLSDDEVRRRTSRPSRVIPSGPSQDAQAIAGDWRRAIDRADLMVAGRSERSARR